MHTTEILDYKRHNLESMDYGDIKLQCIRRNFGHCIVFVLRL